MVTRYQYRLSTYLGTVVITALVATSGRTAAWIVDVIDSAACPVHGFKPTARLIQTSRSPAIGSIGSPSRPETIPWACGAFRLFNKADRDRIPQISAK